MSFIAAHLLGRCLCTTNLMSFPCKFSPIWFSRYPPWDGKQPQLVSSKWAPNTPTPSSARNKPNIKILNVLRHAAALYRGWGEYWCVLKGMQSLRLDTEEHVLANLILIVKPSRLSVTRKRLFWFKFIVVTRHVFRTAFRAVFWVSLHFKLLCLHIKLIS